MKEEKTEKMRDKIIEQVEEAINSISEKGIEPNNLDNLGKLIDIHKDLKDEEYWKIKEEYYMRYRTGNEEYGRRNYRGDDMSYGRRSRDSRGRYTGRGRDARYRGHDMIDEMYENYGNYAEANEEHRRGNYGAKNEMLESIDDTMGAVYDLVCVISEDATPEVMNIIRKHIKKMSEL